MMRILHLWWSSLPFVAAAVHVYKIKFDSTVQAERVAKLRAEIKREHDAIAALRAEWASSTIRRAFKRWRKRHLALKPIDPSQFDSIDRLPERPPQLVPPDASDPIAVIIENIDNELPTSSIVGSDAIEHA